MIISQTPLRISFLGGNTDFPQFYKRYGGGVLTTAIDKYIYCIITKRFDEKIYVNWSKKEIVDDVSQIEHELVREALKKLKIFRGIEVTFLSDIPADGSGLGSSSSVTVGVLNALYSFKGLTVSAEQLAKEAIEIEVDILKKPIGIQDQYIAAYGGLRYFEFEKSGQVNSHKINLEDGVFEDLDNSLMLFYTGRARKSEAILTNLTKTLDDQEKIRLLLETRDIARKGYRDFCQKKVGNIGNLLKKGWEIKKGMAVGISDSQIDKMYETALMAGAEGGKIAGAGGGGFMLLVVPYEKRSKVRLALKDYREVPFRLEPEGSKIIFNYRNN